MDDTEHYCETVDTFPPTKFLQLGSGDGKKILILGEAPAPNGWRKSGRAFYTVEGKLLPTGRNLNKLLTPFNLNVEICGFTELVKCYPGKNRKLLESCGEKCWPILLKQLRENSFTLIILLGVKTLEIFSKLINQDIKMGTLTNVTIERKVYKVLPIYHPSPIAPFNHAKNTLIFESQRKILKTLL